VRREGRAVHTTFGRIVRWLVLLALASAALFWLHGGQPAGVPKPGDWPQVTLAADDRILVLAPHPDDETIACGGILQQAVARKLPVRAVYLTYGDSNQWSFMLYRRRPEILPNQVEGMGEVRHDEALHATQILGIPKSDVVFLGYPDFGTLSIWEQHWGSAPPYRALLTRATAVPYGNAFHPGAAYKGDAVLADLTAQLRDFRPTKVFVSHPIDQNPDHLALYLFTRVALWDLAGEMQPTLYPYLVHYPGWPQPSGYHPTDTLEPPDRVARPVNWQRFSLTQDETQRKLTALQAHRTQYEASAGYLLSFIRTDELFGDYPPLELSEDTADGSAPPTPGPPLSSRGLAPRPSPQPPAAPDQLTDSERARFVGVESRRMWLDHGDMVISVGLSEPLGRGVEMSVYAFGYRADRPFAQMPKLHVQVGEFRHMVYDGDRTLPQNTVTVDRQARQITVRIPLQTLDDPQRVLTSARTYIGNVPLNTASWRVAELY
jgi:LmbE family N-acetylglucosaminyl deacetylase